MPHNTLRNNLPRPPRLLINRHPINPLHLHALKRVIHRQRNNNLHHHIINLIPSIDLRQQSRSLDNKRFLLIIRSILLLSPLRNLTFHLLDQDGREDLLSPLVDGKFQLPRAAVRPPVSGKTGCEFETGVVEVADEPAYVSLWGFRVDSRPQFIG